MSIFEKIDENEINKLKLKQTKIFIFLFVLGFLFLIFLYLLGYFLEIYNFSTIILIVFLIYFFVILYFFIIKSYLGSILVTNKRILFFQKYNFLDYESFEIYLEDIKEIKTKKIGFFQNSFNFGNIEILTENKKYLFKNILNTNENIKEILFLIK